MSRTRSKNVNENPTIQLNHVQSGVPYDTSHTSTWIRNDEMVDELSPNYFKIVKEKGLLPINPMTQTKWSYKGTHGATEWRQSYPADTPLITSTLSGDLALVGFWSSQSWYDDPAAGLWAGFPSWPSDGPVSVSALARARSAGMDVGTALAELGKTIEMVKSFRNNVFRRAHSIAESLGNRHRWKAPKQGGLPGLDQDIYRAFSETWLEGRYGWRTLAYELEDLTIALIKLDDLGLRRVRGYATDENVTSVTARNGNYALVKIGKGVSASNSAVGHVLVQQDLKRVKRSGSIIDAVMQGLAFVDPLITTYEVIPYSFIFDWFVNLNDNIEAFSPFALGRRLGSWITASEIVETTITVTPQLTTGSPYTHELLGTRQYISVATREWKTRYEVTPSFSLTFDVNLNSAKIVDLASIFFIQHLKLMKDLAKSVRI